MLSVLGWNLQGSKDDPQKTPRIERYMEIGVDILCLQEVTTPLGSFSEGFYSNGVYICWRPSPTRTLRSSDKSRYICYYYCAGTQNHRCSLAIYTKLPVIDFGVYPLGGGANSRPLLWIKFQIGVNSIVLGNVHLASGAAAFAIKQFQEAKGFLSTQGATAYLMIGDFNLQEGIIRKKLEGDKAHFYSIAGPTHKSGSKLDYCYSAYKPVSINFDGEAWRAGLSDHKSILYNF